MRIGFFGNNNNYPLLLAEAMRRAGHDVLFVVNKNQRLHRPESRDPERYGSGYPDWIVDEGQLNEWDCMTLQPTLGPVLDRLNTCDALVLNDLGPSFLPLLDPPAITFLTGSDLDYYGNEALPDVRLAGCSEDFRNSPAGRTQHRQTVEFVRRQRQGFRDSRGVIWALPGLFPTLDQLLLDCGVLPTSIFNVQMADLGRIQPVPPPDGRRLRIFCGTRLNWKLPVAPGRSLLDYKGTDVMLHGVSRFVRATGRPIELCIVKKGMHVAETEALVQELGLADQVTWLAEMPLQDLWQQFLASDVIVEQLGGSIISMVALDAMACGRPVIGNVRPEVPTPFSGEHSPVCAAATADEVHAQLLRLNDPAERHRIGAASRTFVERHFGPSTAVDACLQRLTAAGTGGTRASSRSWMLAELHNERTHAEMAERSLQMLDNENSLGARQLLARHHAAWHDERARLVDAVWALHKGRRSTIARVLKARFVHDAGHSWVTALPDLVAFGDGDHGNSSGLLLFEDERLLGPAHETHDNIRRLGGGRFSHWREQLYFSTSDGSDPNRNQRTYTILLPARR